jgi:hypothetical protein
VAECWAQKAKWRGGHQKRDLTLFETQTPLSTGLGISGVATGLCR